MALNISEGLLFVAIFRKMKSNLGGGIIEVIDRKQKMRMIK